MDTHQFTVVIEPDEADGGPSGAYHAFVPALPGCHSFGATVDEAQANILEAIELHVECIREDAEPIPVEGEPMFITRLSVPVLA